MSARGRVAGAALAATALLVPATASAVPAGSTALIDRPSGLGALPFDGASVSQSGPQAISAGANRYVVFNSASDALLAGDDNSGTHVYRLDRQTGTVQQVDISSSGAQPQLGALSGDESISADGRYVAFDSTADDLVPNAPAEGVYVKDMTTGDMALASRSTGAYGTPAGEALGVISGDGRHVAFIASGRFGPTTTMSWRRPRPTPTSARSIPEPRSWSARPRTDPRAGLSCNPVRSPLISPVTRWRS
jgi:hypothetical protein